MKSGGRSPIRFVLVALCGLYLGTKNVKQAFTLAPFSEWVAINWLLFIVGIVLLLLIIPCIYFAQTESNEKKRAEAEKMRELEKKSKERYLYDEEFSQEEKTENE